MIKVYGSNDLSLKGVDLVEILMMRMMVLVLRLSNQEEEEKELAIGFQGTGVRVGRSRRSRRPREGNDERVDDLNGQGNNQGMGANEGVEGVNGNVKRANREAPNFLTIIAQQLQNLLPAMLAQVDNQGNVRNQNGNVNYAMVRAGHAAYTDRFHELVRLVPHLVTLKSRMIESALTDEAVRIGSIKKVEKRGNMGEPNKDKNGRDDNKRTRTGNVFAIIVNPVKRENK
nr:reverse transcriptase domain-containing protein [Tanacetum cinerariifolium]